MADQTATELETLRRFERQLRDVLETLEDSMRGLLSLPQALVDEYHRENRAALASSYAMLGNSVCRVLARRQELAREGLADLKSVPAADREQVATTLELDLYPTDWPRCACGAPVLDGRATCGGARCAPFRAPGGVA